MNKLLALAIALAIAVFAQAADAEAPLTLERTIVLDNVSGRIDHMTLDSAAKRLFVAELGNGTVDIVDLQAGKAVNRIGNLREPQGVAYVADEDLIVVACAGDGSVRFYRGADLKPVKTIALGDDADNIRIDPATSNILVGYGEGGLAIIDPKTQSKVGEIRLSGHPEAFQIDTKTHRVFVNMPDAHEIAAVDLNGTRPAASWRTRGLGSNFPMALGETGTPLAVVFRNPPTLAILELGDGRDHRKVKGVRRRRRCLLRREARPVLHKLRRGRDRRHQICRGTPRQDRSRDDFLGSPNLDLRAAARPAICCGSCGLAGIPGRHPGLSSGAIICIARTPTTHRRRRNCCRSRCGSRRGRTHRNCWRRRKDAGTR